MAKNKTLAFIAQKGIKKFLKQNKDELSVILETSNVTHLNQEINKISLSSLENRQHFYSNILPYSKTSPKVVKTIMESDYSNFDISEYFSTQKDFEQYVNIEPFKDLRKKAKKEKTSVREKRILELCEKYKIVFGISKDIYKKDKDDEFIRKDGEKVKEKEGGKVVVAISQPTMAVSEFDFEEIVLISGDVVKKYWGVQTLSFLNSREENKNIRNVVKHLLNFMENADISDLHMGQSDDDSYFITARQHTKIIDVTDENNEVIRYPTGRANNISNMLLQMANEDTESKALAQNGV